MDGAVRRESRKGRRNLRNDATKDSLNPRNITETPRFFRNLTQKSEPWAADP